MWRNCFQEWKLVQPLWRTLWGFLKNPHRTTPIETPYRTITWSNNPFLGHIPWKKHIISKGHMYPNVNCSPIHKRWTWKWSKCPSTNEWIKKLWYIYTMDYYSAIKKQWNWVICRDVDEPGVCHTEWNKLVGERQVLYVDAIWYIYISYGASLVAQMVHNLLVMLETWVWSLGQEDTLEEDMATHSSILAWRIPWTEEPGRLQSTGSQRIRHDWVTKHSTAYISLSNICNLEKWYKWTYLQGRNRDGDREWKYGLGEENEKIGMIT